MKLDRSVIAIDPGYDRVGIAVFDDTTTLLHSECFSPNTRVFGERLVEIRERVQTLIRKFSPASVALETLFFSKNQRTALKVAEARGAIILAAAELGLGIHEYSPQAVKIAVTGSGSADKAGVMKMVAHLVPLGNKKRLDDELDAIALGMAHQAGFSLSPDISTGG